MIHRLLIICLMLFAMTPLRAVSDKAKLTISILGDSYSTFEGYVPSGNVSWYATTAWENRTDVVDVRQTWWWQLISEGGYILGVNESYSGSTISYTGYNNEDYRDRSFLTRLPRLGASDILMIVGQVDRLGSLSMITSLLGICMNFVLLLGNCFRKLKIDILVLG